MKKEVLYYVLKYENKYYCPYTRVRSLFDPYEYKSMLTDNKRLATRFATKEVADSIHKSEIQYSTTYSKDFDPTKCKVVAIVSKRKRK